MKIRNIAWLLLAVLLLSGCSAAGTRTMDAAENAVRERVDAAEDTLENFINTAGTQTTAAAPAGGLTREQAEAIALEHAGFTADQVRGLRTEYEIDDGVPRFEVQFRQGRWEYDYEINAQTGDILSYDRDD